MVARPRPRSQGRRLELVLAGLHRLDRRDGSRDRGPEAQASRPDDPAGARHLQQRHPAAEAVRGRGRRNAEDKAKAFAEKPIGTGPFMLTAWKRGVSMTLVRNPYYWKQGEDGKALPYLDELEFQIIPDDCHAPPEAEGGRDRRRRVHPLFAREGAAGDPNLRMELWPVHPRGLPHLQRAVRPQGRQAEPAVQREGAAGAELRGQQGRHHPDHHAGPRQADAVLHVFHDAALRTDRRRSTPTTSPRPRRCWPRPGSPTASRRRCCSLSPAMATTPPT